VLEPDFIVAPEVRSGRLQRLLTDYQPPRSPIAACTRAGATCRPRCAASSISSPRVMREPGLVLSPAVQAG